MQRKSCKFEERHCIEIQQRKETFANTAVREQRSGVRKTFAPSFGFFPEMTK